MSVAGIISSIWRFVFPGPEKKVPDIFDDGGVKIFGQRRRDTCCRDGRDEGDLVTVFAHAVQDCGRGEEGGEIIGGVFFLGDGENGFVAGVDDGVWVWGRFWGWTGGARGRWD